MHELLQSPDQYQTSASQRRPWETPELREIGLEDGTEANKPALDPTETAGNFYGPASS